MDRPRGQLNRLRASRSSSPILASLTPLTCEGPSANAAVVFVTTRRTYQAGTSAGAASAEDPCSAGAPAITKGAPATLADKACRCATGLGQARRAFGAYVGALNLAD